MKSVIAVALVASASAFVPAQNARVPTKLNFEYGEYDDKLWDNDSKKDVYDKWDPKSPRSTKNFNPFETFKGNSPDASGIYPGEVSVYSCAWFNHFSCFIFADVHPFTVQQPRYKDPIRGDVNFAAMMAEKAEAEEREANPKDGSEKGCAGCKN